MLGTAVLLLVVAASTSTPSMPSTPTSTPSNGSGGPSKILVVAAAGVTSDVEQSVRTQTAARGFAVRSADATRASLASARELGLDCGTDDGADACWRRVAALALDDAIIVINKSPAGITLRLLDARADVPPRVVSAQEDAAAVSALTASLFEPPATSPATSHAGAATPPPDPATVPESSSAPPASAPQAQPLDVVSLGVVVGTTSAALALASGVSVIVIQQAVLEDASASGSTKATAFGAGLVLMGTTVVFAVGALLGVGMVVVGGEDAEGETSDMNGTTGTSGGAGTSTSKVES